MALAAVVSAGMSEFGRREGLSAAELLLEALEEALAGVKNLDGRGIGAVYVGSQSETYEHQIMYGTQAADMAGLLPKGALRVEGCAAAGGLAFRLAVLDVLSGLHDVVLAAGMEKMTARTTSQVTDALMAASHPLEQRNGFTFPSLYALSAVAHMHRYGSSQDDLALVAVKNHRNGALNPKAHLRNEITHEQAASSKVVAWPLRLYDCSPISDGAAVAIVTPLESAKRFTDAPVYVAGSGHACDTLGLFEREDLSWPGAAAAACEEAYRMARVKPHDINVAEVHDAFTINEILLCEAAGFAKRGEGHLLVREGETNMEGSIPVNPSGGLKARGHPTGATGIAQVYELFLQLRGEAERRQVSGPKAGFAVNEGGSNAVVTAHVLTV